MPSACKSGLDLGAYSETGTSSSVSSLMSLTLVVFIIGTKGNFNESNISLASERNEFCVMSRTSNPKKGGIFSQSYSIVCLTQHSP